MNNKQSIFLEEIVGSKAKVRILSFLYNFSDLDYSVSNITNECGGISWNTSSKELKKLYELGLVTNTRTIGSQKYYKAVKNEIYTAFIELENKVTDYIRNNKKG